MHVPALYPHGAPCRHLAITVPAQKMQKQYSQGTLQIGTGAAHIVQHEHNKERKGHDSTDHPCIGPQEVLHPRHHVGRFGWVGVRS